MKKRFTKYFPPIFILGEMIVLTIIFFSSIYIAEGEFLLNQTYLFSLIIYLSIWPIISYFNKDYNMGRAVSYYTTLKRAFGSAFIFVSVISLVWLFSNVQMLDRHFLMALVLLLFLWLSIYRVSVHLVLDKYRTFGGNVCYAVIVGYDKLGKNLFDLLKRKSHYGIQCAGIYGDGGAERVDEYPCLGGFDDFAGANLADIDYIYVSEKVPKSIMERVIKIGDSSLTKIKLLPEFKTDALKTFVLRRYESIPIIDVNNLPLDLTTNKVLKRTFDIVFSLFVTVFILSWMIPIFGLIIRLESKGGVIFRQARNGIGNEPFACLKFRTMVVNEEADSDWAVKGDPRITRFGAFLRKTSLDEFPQFINVLLGDMSIVGPRPHPISLNKEFETKVEKFARRHASKPGVTGLAQAMGYRGEIRDFYNMNSRVKLDRFYLQNWSFLLDVKIVFLTIVSVIKETENAY